MAMLKKLPSKTIDKTYIFKTQEANLSKSIVNAIMGATVIDINSKEFEEIRYDIKRRQLSKFVSTILEMPRVRLIISKKPMPNLFKVLTAKDIRGLAGAKNKFITYIDVTGIVEMKHGKYECASIEALISLLMSASTNILWYNGSLVESEKGIKEYAVTCYSRLFTNVINYLAKINNVPGQKNRCLYATSLFFLSTVMEKEDLDKNIEFCRKSNDLSERETEMINTYLSLESFDSLDNFVITLGKILNIKGLDTASIIRTWAKLYSPKTLFGLEYFPSFSEMLTDAYTGAYLNNQTTIEKVCGNAMPSYCNELITIGGNYAGRDYK